MMAELSIGSRLEVRSRCQAKNGPTRWIDRDLPVIRWLFLEEMVPASTHP